MPEEINRLVADSVADLLFIHSPEARTNLLDEGAPEESIFPVGNTMIDTLVAMLPRVDQASTAASLGLHEQDYLLVTLHRPALTDGPLLAEAIGELRNVARELPVVFPVHPRTRARIEAEQLDTERITLLDPLGYIEFMSLVALRRRTAHGLRRASRRRPPIWESPASRCARTRSGRLPSARGPTFCSDSSPAESALCPSCLPTVAGVHGRRSTAGMGTAAQRVADVLAGAALPSRVQLTEARRPRLQSANPDESQAA